MRGGVEDVKTSKTRTSRRREGKISDLETLTNRETGFVEGRKGVVGRTRMTYVTVCVQF